MTLGSESQLSGEAEMGDANEDRVETNVIDSTTDCLPAQIESVSPHRHSSDTLKSQPPSNPDLVASAEPPPPPPSEAVSETDPPSPPSSDPTPTPSFTSPLSLPPSPPPRSLTMPKIPMLTNLPDLALHSPNGQIVGTPFTTNNNNKFEYPFPDSSSSSADSSLSSYLSGNPSFSSSFPTIISPNQLSSSPPSLSNFPTTFPPQSEISNYTPAHPKMRQPNSPPPMPPGLVKKKHRWSLGLLGRRRSSQTSEGSTPGAVTSMDAVVERAPTPSPGGKTS
ncbi:hypothetical protein BDQ17DRAFT_1422886 [Cyathus striatus]|nr:hypothetical protein BDQ17DRAFT_1422886 [Cyathus striatus]